MESTTPSFRTSPQTIQFINAVPSVENIATFHWLFDGWDTEDKTSPWSHALYLARLQEAAGQSDEALAGYKSVLSHTPPRSGTRWDVAYAGVKRLSPGAR